MLQKERVAIVQRRYPRYNKQLDSCVTHGDETGVRLRPDAAEAVRLAAGKPKVSDKYINIAARISREFIQPDELRRWLIACGYASTTAWICANLKRLQAEYAARQKKSAPAAPKADSQNTQYEYKVQGKDCQA